MFRILVLLSNLTFIFVIFPKLRQTYLFLLHELTSFDVDRFEFSKRYARLSSFFYEADLRQDRFKLQASTCDVIAVNVALVDPHLSRHKHRLYFSAVEIKRYTDMNRAAQKEIVAAAVVS